MDDDDDDDDEDDDGDDDDESQCFKRHCMCAIEMQNLLL